MAAPSYKVTIPGGTTLVSGSFMRCITRILDAHESSPHLIMWIRPRNDFRVVARLDPHPTERFTVTFIEHAVTVPSDQWPEWVHNVHRLATEQP